MNFITNFLTTGVESTLCMMAKARLIFFFDWDLKTEFIVTLVFSVVVSTGGVIIGVRALNEDARKNDTPNSKGEKSYSFWSVLSAWIMAIIIIFCSIFFASRSWFGT